MKTTNTTPELQIIENLLNDGVKTENLLIIAQQHEIDFRYILHGGNTCLVYAAKAKEPFGAYEHSFKPNRLQLHAIAQGKSLFTVDHFNSPAEPY